MIFIARHKITTPQPLATYRYDGLGRRVYKHVENSGDASAGGRNCEEYYYYNHNWQLLEIRNAADKPRQQFVWSTQYIDEPICMDVDTDTSGAGYGNCTDAGSRRFFYMQDANYNVIALREAGTIVERYEYDPYGTVRVVRGWNNVAGAEDGSVAGQSLKWLDATLPSNPYLYAGYFHDWETGADNVRRRVYNSRLGRWMQRDPLQYIDGMNYYLYALDNPVGCRDFSGMWVIGPGFGVSGTIFLPASGFAVGLQLSYTLQYFCGLDTRTNPLSPTAISKWCDTGAVTVMAGVGAAVNVSAGPVISIGSAGPSEGPGVQIGGGAGIPVTPAILGPAIEGSWDIDVDTGTLTMNIPRWTLGATLYIAVRLTGSCTGCSQGCLSLVSGAQTRIGKVLSCMKRVQAAMNTQIKKLNGLKNADTPVVLKDVYGSFSEDKIPGSCGERR